MSLNTPTSSVNQLVAQLRENDGDYEFYPTTDEIIARMVRDLKSLERDDRYGYKGVHSALDVGAGHGKVLRALRDQAKISDLYAIEKSPLLCQQLDADIFIVGTEFAEQSLLAKQVDVVFSNPPYSEFQEWAVRIIRESAAPTVYLVIPVRWKDSTVIQDALKFREAKANVLGEFSFEDAEDRAARARVNLIRVDLIGKDDAFDRFFDEQFADLKAKFAARAKADRVPEAKEGEKDGDPRFRSLVVGENYPERLVSLYETELDHIRKNYDLVQQLDVELLKEFDVTPDRVLGCLKARLAGLRNTYWHELFAHMSQVTDRLTSRKRRIMLDKLNANGHVDFTLTNIHAVIIWVLNNANGYLDAQLTETFETMLEKANVRNYVSNARPFVYDRWRYSEEKPSHVALEYRIVLEHVGGVNRGYSGIELNESAGQFIGDLLTVARNLGFICNTNDPRVDRNNRRGDWQAGTLQVFDCTVNGRTESLLEVRAFLNRNLHIRMNQKFALALNVEYGRLKGWLGSGAEAAEELADPKAGQYFAKNLQLGQHSLPMLAAPVAPAVAA